MSALLTEAAMGLLLGVALNFRTRDLWIAALLPALPDIDHIPLFHPGIADFLVPRGTLHNVFFTIGVPLAVWAILRVRSGDARWQRVALAAPLILTSHILLDLLPLDPLGSIGSVELFYPLSTHAYTVRYVTAGGFSPTEYSTFTLMLLLLAAAVLLVRLAIDRLYSARTVGALAAGWIVLFPALLMGSGIIPTPDYPQGELALSSPTIRLPDAHLIMEVHMFAGENITPTLQVSNMTTIIANITHPSLQPGDTWGVDALLPGNPRTFGTVTIFLIDARSGHVYARAPAGTVRSHVDSHLVIAAGALHNEGNFTIPSFALNVTARVGAAVVYNGTNGQSIGPDQSWKLPLVPSNATWALRAVDDGFLYVQGPAN